MTIQVIPVQGLPLIGKGDDIPSLVCDRIAFEDGDILVLASTIYSKSKGYTRKLTEIVPSERAERIARRDREDPRFVQSVLDEAKDVLLEHPFILSELPFGHIGVRSGVDRSNIEDGMVILLPPDPMGGAAEIRGKIRSISGKDVGVVITDTCGRAFRRGQTGNAIGWAGFPAIRDYRNDTDLFGHVLLITEEAVVDEIAGFANFVMGESHQGIPAAVFRGCGRWTGHDDLYFKPAEDIIRKAIHTYVTKEPSRSPEPKK
ncbi:MAG: coenzyme F420-0:L-glutamate ligase [Methanomicrobiales archaeon]|nr:coenzyme F420-0:L-glutamate ligase [Methanomicrobiales archaeon]MDD1669636.1 coenzyme F420-0:L-glutamate ligase [Methanomicrobiales archaeon]